MGTYGQVLSVRTVYHNFDPVFADLFGIHYEVIKFIRSTSNTKFSFISSYSNMTISRMSSNRSRTLIRRISRKGGSSSNSMFSSFLSINNTSRNSLILSNIKVNNLIIITSSYYISFPSKVKSPGFSSTMTIKYQLLVTLGINVVNLSISGS